MTSRSDGGTGPRHRTFIIQEKVDPFDGTGSVAVNKRWWERLPIVGDDWTPNECCRNLDLYLEEPAEAWLLQIARSAKRNWDTLAEAFRREFCIPPPLMSTPLERYHLLHQRNGESSRQYLCRLNGAANSAKLPYTSPDGIRSTQLDSSVRSRTRMRS